MSPIDHRLHKLRTEPHYVYVCEAPGGRVLYVGCTLNVAKRMAEHKGKSWHSLVTAVHVSKYPDWWMARRAEALAIRSFAPEFNKVRMTGRADIPTPASVLNATAVAS